MKDNLCKVVRVVDTPVDLTTRLFESFGAINAEKAVVLNEGIGDIFGTRVKCESIHDKIDEIRGTEIRIKRKSGTNDC